MAYQWVALALKILWINTVNQFSKYKTQEKTADHAML